MPWPPAAVAPRASRCRSSRPRPSPRRTPRGTRAGRRDRASRRRGAWSTRAGRPPGSRGGCRSRRSPRPGVSLNPGARCPVLSADMRRPSPPIRLVAVVLAGAMAIVGAPTSGAGEWPTKKPAVRLVVTFDRGTSEATRDGVAEDAGTVVSELDQIRTRVVQVPAKSAVAVQRRLRAERRGLLGRARPGEDRRRRPERSRRPAEPAAVAGPGGPPRRLGVHDRGSLDRHRHRRHRGDALGARPPVLEAGARPEHHHVVREHRRRRGPRHRVGLGGRDGRSQRRSAPPAAAGPARSCR